VLGHAAAEEVLRRRGKGRVRLGGWAYVGLRRGEQGRVRNRAISWQGIENHWTRCRPYLGAGDAGLAEELGFLGAPENCAIRRARRGLVASSQRVGQQGSGSGTHQGTPSRTQPKNHRPHQRVSLQDEQFSVAPFTYEHSQDLEPVVHNLVHGGQNLNSS